MSARDVMAALEGTPLKVGDQQWSGDWHTNYIQYLQRCPGNCDKSLHYEVKVNDNDAIDVCFHAESHTDRSVLENVVLKLKDERHRLGETGDFDISTHGKKIKMREPVDCSRSPVEECIKQIEAKMERLYTHFEPMIKDAIADVGGNTAETSEECSKAIDANKVILPNCMKQVLEKDGEKPAAVYIDTDGWPSDMYDESVKELCEVREGVHSWISTVEDVILRAAVTIDGCKVKPAQFRIPPYQRKFAWKERDVRQLCRDLLSVDDETHYHLGTIILHHESRAGEVWNVVDGQQRLTNIMSILDAPIFETPIKQFLKRDYDMIKQAIGDYQPEEVETIKRRLIRCTLAFISVENVAEAFQLFTTQNGRGKPLTPVNLLKAYHYKEMELEKERMSDVEFEALLEKTETEWESANVADIRSAPGDGKMLLHVFREYLYRLRQWNRGRFPENAFGIKNIGEFKGVSIKKKTVGGIPLQNEAVLRTGALTDGEFVACRRDGDAMNAYVTICQTIVNGRDFFDYAHSYVAAYKDLFVEGVLKEFHDFYMDCCKPGRHKSGAAMYARHVYEALCMFCYDRFGEAGLKAAFKALYACAYYERVSQTRVLYRRCGITYAPKAVEIMMTTHSVPEMQQELNEVRSEIRNALVGSAYVKALLKKMKRTQGEELQLAAFNEIFK